MTNMRDGMTAGLMPPRFLLEKVVVQAQGMARSSPEASPFAHPLTEFPSSFSQRDRVRLRDSGLAAIREAVLPAYARFAAFVSDEYAPRGRTDPGIWALPDGAERYAALARFHTTTRLTPDEIHEIGLQQVADLERQMMEIATRLGFHDLKTLERGHREGPAAAAEIRRARSSRSTAATSTGCTRSCRSSSAASPRRRSSSSPSRSSARPRPPPPTTTRVRPTAHAPVASRSTRAIRSRARRSRWSPRRTTRACPATTSRSSIGQELAGASSVSATGQLHRVRRGVGPLYRAPREGDRILQGSLQRLRPSPGLDAPGDPPRRGHGRPRQEVEPRPDDPVLPRPLGRGRSRPPERDRSVHRVAGPGARLQDRPAQDPGAARAEREGAGARFDIRRSTTRSSERVRFPWTSSTRASTPGSRRSRRADSQLHTV